MDEAFYAPAGDGRFESSDLTRGPWDERAQHAGPPAALLGRAFEGLQDGERWQVGRITCEVLRPVPIAPLRVEAAIARPGRSVQLVEASLDGDDGEPIMRARGWRLLRQDVALAWEAGAAPPSGGPAGPGPEESRAVEFFPVAWDRGYHTAMEWRFARGAFREPGPAVAWGRMRVALVAGEQPSPFQRVLTAADSGNGISAALDYTRYVFVNTDLTVHLHREPEGEWVCLDSTTHAHEGGLGMTDTLLADERGPIGRAAQTLLVAAR